ncbi:MAG: hypothetical protein JJU22_10980 [Gammaproteobacteria bacterium]|nr:hypothetical protein [Gammaproteobacteria bacterium]
MKVLVCKINAIRWLRAFFRGLFLVSFAFTTTSAFGVSPFVINPEHDSRPPTEIAQERMRIADSIRDIEPTQFNHRAGTYGAYFHMGGPWLGSVDPEDVTARPEHVVRQVLDRYRDATRYHDEVQLKMLDPTDHRTGRVSIRFRQMIDGAPVLSEGRITIDSETGDVRVIRSYLADERVLEDLEPLVTKSEAHELAFASLAEMLDNDDLKGDDELSTKVEETQLEYYEVGKNLRVEPFWILRLAVAPFDDQSFRGPYLFHVNARTGEVTNYSQFIRHGGYVCRNINQTAATCEDTVQHVGGWPMPFMTERIFEDGDCIATVPSNCDLPVFEKPKDVYQALKDLVGQYSDDCCDQISDLDIMTDSPWSGLTMPTYSFGNEFIFIPEQGLAESQPFYQNVDLASNEKVVAHEAAHHIQAHLNTNIFLKRIGSSGFCVGSHSQVASIPGQSRRCAPPPLRCGPAGDRPLTTALWFPCRKRDFQHSFTSCACKIPSSTSVFSASKHRGRSTVSTST